VTEAAAETADADAPPVCYRHPKRETYVTCQRCGRPICPECQIQAPVGVQCPECVREGRAAAQGGPNPLRRVARVLRPSGVPIVTYALIGVCVVIFGLQFLTGQKLTDAWVMDPSMARSEPWRLITSGFLHSPAFLIPIHLLFNMYALFAFGPVLESFLGRARYLVLYLVALLGGSVAEVVNYQLIVATNGAITVATDGFITASQSLGASGAIFGLMGALLAGRKAMGIHLRQLLIVVVLNLALGFFVPNIAWQAHLGGFAIGAAVMGVYLVTRRKEARTRQILAVAGIVAGLILILVVCVATAPFAYA
jgi:membrane associated rhomboid family serine protease